MSDSTQRGIVHRTKVYTGAFRWLSAKLSADVDLDTQPVQFSFNRIDWIAGEFVGPVAKVRRARMRLNETTMPEPGTWPVYVRIPDDPDLPDEADIDQAGVLEVI